MRIPTDILGRIQFFIGDDKENEKLKYAFPEDYKHVIRYYFDEIEFSEIRNKEKNKIFSLRIRTSVNLKPFSRLKKLNCSYCNLTTLPELPQVTTLYCSRNQLTTLPLMPQVTILNCSENRLTVGHN